jgi:hypothetical protein
MKKRQEQLQKMKEEESKKLDVADPMTAMADETDPLAAVT